MCWDPDQASKIAKIIESEAFEPHPVSGEVEVGDVSTGNYRRLDEETLQCKIEIYDLGLVIIFLWCEGDHEGGGSGWRVSEVIPSPLTTPGEQFPWWGTIVEAIENFQEPSRATTSQERSVPLGANALKVEEDDDDDDYWAQYDNTPARTPAAKRSPAPTVPNGVSRGSGRARTTSEAEYFAQYAQVQPALDNDDPSGERPDPGQWSLDGNVINDSITLPRRQTFNSNSTLEPPSEGSLQASAESIIHTRPSSSSSSSGVVTRLEDSAASRSHAEVAVQQHISTSMKSMFRLARNTGMEREEFERLVRTELDTLSMMEED